LSSTPKAPPNKVIIAFTLSFIPNPLNNLRINVVIDAIEKVYVTSTH